PTALSGRSRDPAQLLERQLAWRVAAVGIEQPADRHACYVPQRFPQASPTLPRRFEGGGGFGNRVADVMLVTVAVELAPRVVQPFDQITHCLPPVRAAGPHVRGVARRRSSRRYRVPDHRLLPATPPPACLRG